MQCVRCGAEITNPVVVGFPEITVGLCVDCSIGWVRQLYTNKSFEELTVAEQLLEFYKATATSVNSSRYADEVERLSRRLFESRRETTAAALCYLDSGRRIGVGGG